MATTPSRAWRDSAKRKVPSVDARLRDLRALTRRLKKTEVIDRAPKIKLPTLQQKQFPVLSEAQVGTLLNFEHLTAPEPQATRNRALIALMLDTGIQRSESSGISMADLELPDQLIKIRGQGNKQRRIPYQTGVESGLQRTVESLAVSA